MQFKIINWDKRLKNPEKWYEHIIGIAKTGEWDWNFKSKKQWAGKPYLHISRHYWDGWNISIHVWRFHLGIHYSTH